MQSGFNDYDRAFSLVDELRRRMGLLMDEEAGAPAFTSIFGQSGSFPRVNVYDDGQGFVLKADVPGVRESDVEISVHQEVITITGERKNDAPEGYRAHRQERGAVKFSRSFAFPCKIDADNAKATVRDGVLTVKLPKAPEAQAKKIAVKAQ